MTQIDNVRVVDPLIQALQDDSTEIREAVTEILGMIKDERAVNPLIQVCMNVDEDGFIRGVAAKALGEIGNGRAIDPLTQLSTCTK